MNESEKEVTGAVIDYPMDKFISALNDQKVNRGTMQNMILLLENVYAQLRSAKDEVIARVESGTLKKDNPQVVDSLNGLYAEMWKIEEKVTYLKKRCKDMQGFCAN